MEQKKYYSYEEKDVIARAIEYYLKYLLDIAPNEPLAINSEDHRITEQGHLHELIRKYGLKLPDEIMARF